jgi:hypothetical protein
MVKPSDIDLPVIFKRQPLFRDGVHNPKTNNNFRFTKEAVNNSVKNTKWSPLNKRLYLKHSGQFDVSKWKGRVENIEAEDGVVYGDVQIWDADEGLQILYGEKPVAISADIEYNDNGLIFYKGFAIENEPGVHDSKMFLSDAVKDELSGMYRASFSSELDNNLIEQNKVDNQSAERRLIKETVNMEGQKDASVSNSQPVNTNSNQPSQPVINVNTTGADTELVRRLAEKVAQLEESNKQNVAVIDSMKNIKPVEKNEGTVADTQLKTVVSNDDKSMDDFVNKVVEKIKPAITPQPITMNEFSGQGDSLTGDQKTINRLAGYFEKKNE